MRYLIYDFIAEQRVVFIGLRKANNGCLLFLLLDLLDDRLRLRLILGCDAAEDRGVHVKK